MPGNLALKSSAALRTSDLATLAPALPRPWGDQLITSVGGAGTWVGTGICDLRASVASQQKQLESLIDRVALLLSSMHSEILQDMRIAVASPDFEARLAEMRNVGEVLDQRLAEMRAEAATVPEGVRMLHVELRRVEEKMDGLDDRVNQDLEKLQSLVTESLMSVHDRFTSELEGVVNELKKLEGRLGSAETDLGLLSDDDLEATCKEAIQQQANTLRSEFQQFVVPYFDQNATRISALEDHLQREHNDLLVALQQAAAATGVQEGDRALQRDWAKRTKEDLRQQSEELSTLSRQMSELKLWQSSATEEAKTLRLEAKRRDEETNGTMQALEERLASARSKMGQLEEKLKTEETEKRLCAMEEVLQGMEENMKVVEPLQRLEDVLSKEVEQRMLNALEEKVDLAIRDLQRQLETQINDLTQREDAQPQRLTVDLKRELEQRLVDANSKTQHTLADLRQEWDARAAQVQRQGDELRRELELKIEKRHSSTEMSMEDLKHEIDSLNAQQQSVGKKHADDLKQLTADVELRWVKEQSAAQRATLELRKDLEHSAQEAVNLCSEVLREEQQQLVREFRQELERRLAQAAPQAPILIEGLDEVNEVRDELHELREAMEDLKGVPSFGHGDGSPGREASRLLRTVEETVAEKVRRCDVAAERCERLARRMEWQLSPEACQGSGVPGEKDAYEGIILQREGPWSLHDSKGRYSFDDTSGWLTAGSKVGRFLCKRLHHQPLTFDSSVSSRMPKLKIVSSDIMVEMQKKENHGALFMVCSQLNGVAYPAKTSLVHHVEDYKYNDASGARAQLAAHPAVAQFLLDNAANVERVAGGINAMDLLLANVKGLEVTNGYLKILPSDEVDNLKKLEKELHALRLLIMEDLAVKGLRPDKRSLAGCQHQVGLVFASAVDVDEIGTDTSDYQLKVVEMILTAQYYGTLRYAAESSQRPHASRRKVFLTPFGPVNSLELVRRSMARAFRMLEEDDLSRLNVCILVEDDAMASQWRGGQNSSSFQSPKASKELFRPSDDSSDENFRPSPIEESSTESRIMVLMRRVDHQASELQSLREKNEELSEAVDQYQLQQKVSRSLAGLETSQT